MKMGTLEEGIILKKRITELNNNIRIIDGANLRSSTFTTNDFNDVKLHLDIETTRVVAEALRDYYVKELEYVEKS